MKSKNKTKLLFLGLIAIFASLYINIINFSDNSLDINEYLEVNDETNFKSSGYWIEPPIGIDGSATGVGAYNWTWAVNQLWCKGAGTGGNPYIIENVTIDGGNSGSCLKISNSADYFIIKNCTLYNCGYSPTKYYAGIELYNTKNGQLINNNCSNNNNIGISLTSNSNDNTISGNYANNNSGVGILLKNSDDCIIFNNTINNNTIGIDLYNYCENNEILDNTANDNSNYGIYLVLYCNDNTISGNIANDNEQDGIRLFTYSNKNKILENEFNFNDIRGIYLGACDNNEILRNTINYNSLGIYLDISNDNDVIGNTLIGNNECIEELSCEGNIIKDNSCGNTSSDDDNDIPEVAIHGYDLWFLMGAIGVISAIVIKRRWKQAK